MNKDKIDRRSYSYTGILNINHLINVCFVHNQLVRLFLLNYIDTFRFPRADACKNFKTKMSTALVHQPTIMSCKCKIREILIIPFASIYQRLWPYLRLNTFLSTSFVKCLTIFKEERGHVGMQVMRIFLLNE